MPDQYSVTANFLDESFHPDDTRNYGLSIVLNESFFSCSVLDFRRNKFLALHHFVRCDGKMPESQAGQATSFNNFLNEIIADHSWLSGSFKMVKIAFDGRRSTLVPAVLFNPDDREEYFAFNFTVESDEVVQADHLMPMDAWQVYSVPTDVLETIKRIFPKNKVIHAASLLIESVWINYKNRISSPGVFMHLRDGMFDLLIFDGRQVSYFNTFSFQNPEDVVYYLIFVLEQLNFNPEKIPLVLLGNVKPGHDLSELLLRYVRHVDTGQRNEAYIYSYVLNQLPPQSYFPLLNFFSCGL
jgi:hypothetical protein